MGLFTAKRDPNHGVMTQERKVTFRNAMTTPGIDPKIIRSVADAFDEVGRPDEAALLRKRARLRELPKAVKDERRKIIRETFNSTNPIEVDAMADAFEKDGATVTAVHLRSYAQGLRIAIGAGIAQDRLSEYVREQLKEAAKAGEQ